MIAERTRSSPLHRHRLWGITIIIVCVVAAAYFRSDMHRHNRFLAQLRRSLAALPLPAETTRLKADAKLGMLAGNGNHCDYIVAETHATERTRAEIEAHYAQLSIPNPENSSSFTPEVAFFADGRPPDLDVNADLDLAAPSHADNLKYVLFVRLIGYHDAGSDLRCH